MKQGRQKSISEIAVFLPKCSPTTPRRQSVVESLGSRKPGLVLSSLPHTVSLQAAWGLDEVMQQKYFKKVFRGRPRGRVVKVTHSFWQPRFCRFGSWAWTWHRSSGQAEAASHMPHPEALTTRIYNYVLEGFGEKKKKERRKKRLATDVSSGANL